MRTTPGNPGNFQPYTSELRINSLAACRAFETAIRNDDSLKLDGIADINKAGLPTAFMAIHVGLQGVALPGDKTLPLGSGISLARNNAEGVHPVDILDVSCADITDILRDDFRFLEHDIAISVLRRPGFRARLRNASSEIREVVRLKGARTSRYENQQLQKQKYEPGS